MAAQQRQLYAFAHLDGGFVPAGRLTLTEEGEEVVASSFAYGLRYLERPGRFPVDPVSLALLSLSFLRYPTDFDLFLNTFGFTALYLLLAVIAAVSGLCFLALRRGGERRAPARVTA